MNGEKTFLQKVISIAVPVALQSMLTTSFSMIDQVMVGQLGSHSIAAIGVAGKFAFMYSTIIGAVAAICGIMISQYMGQKNAKLSDRSLCINLFYGIILASVFFMPSLILPEKVIGLYTGDISVIAIGSGYLRIISGTYPAIGIATILAVSLRCNDKSVLPLAAGIASAVVNTILNYLLIFGKGGLPELGVQGAAIASLISQWVNAAIVTLFFLSMLQSKKEHFRPSLRMKSTEYRDYFKMLLPVVITEFLWSLGQNVFAGIYGHIGTREMASVQLISPVESLCIGALSGVAQAAGILIGKRLGSGENEKAYEESKKLMQYGILGSVLLSAVLIFLRGYYVQIYNVEDSVQEMAAGLLVCFALLAPFKVTNMILGGGIIRSGGKTDYVMWIDLFGTWVIGVPLGFLTGHILSIPIMYVYLFIGLEEIIRVLISVIIFRSRKWMVKI